MYWYGVQTASEVSQSSVTSESTQPSKLSQRALFFSARKQGHSVSASARIAGVSRATGVRWSRLEKASQAELSERLGAVATKTQVVAELTRIGMDEGLAPRDKVNALAALNKAMGYDAPTRTENVTLIVQATSIDLIKQRTAARLAATNADRALSAEAIAIKALPDKVR